LERKTPATEAPTTPQETQQAVPQVVPQVAPQATAALESTGAANRRKWRIYQ